MQRETGRNARVQSVCQDYRFIRPDAREPETRVPESSYLPERRLQRLELSVEDGMRMVLTAGMHRPRTDDPPTQGV